MTNGSIVIQRNSYVDGPICVRCGHGPGVHNLTKCAAYYRELGGRTEATCDCPGWERDPAWPPPVVVER